MRFFFSFFLSKNSSAQFRACVFLLSCIFLRAKNVFSYVHHLYFSTKKKYNKILFFEPEKMGHAYTQNLHHTRSQSRRLNQFLGDA